MTKARSRSKSFSSYEIGIDALSASSIISLREDIYRRLKRAKREGESYSEVIERLLRPDDDILDLFGTIPMTDEERRVFFDGLDEMWGAWEH